MDILKFILLIIGSYFIGNISFARIFAKFQKNDITKEGSGNPGTMNMLRNHGFIMAFGTLLFDALKGAVPAICGVALFNGFSNPSVTSNIALYVGGTTAVIGHCFPVIYKFKGGKGIATAFGMYCVANPIVSFIAFAIFFTAFVLIKIGSLCTLTYILVMTIAEITVCWLRYGAQSWPMLLMIILIFVLIMFAHRTNLKKLAHFKERKVDLKNSVKKDKELISSISSKNEQANKEIDNEINNKGNKDNKENKENKDNN